MLIPKVEQRIAQYLHFLKPNRYRELTVLRFETFETGETFRAPPEGVRWEKIPSPYEYGNPWLCSWFRASFRTPPQSLWPLYLRVVPNADSLVFIDGKPVGAFNPVHKKIRVNPDGEDHTLHLESYAGHYYPGCHPFEGKKVMITLGRQIEDFPNLFEGGALVERVEPVYSLYYDVLCLLELAQSLDANSLRRARILKGLYDALMGIHYSSAGKLLEEEAAGAAKQIAPLMEAKNGSTVPEIHLIGHAHIDHAWLWHIGETERKAARTYMNMVHLSREYPEFVFIQTQPAQLEGIKKQYPEIFSAVREAFEKGNWEPNGGMWVEADCNISGGESLVRQFLVGKAATKEMLDYEGDTLWLPDVFGYAAALPQILAGCRINYFVTSKINWNDTTRFPYDTFIWRGIDGTGVKTHYISSRKRGYNGKVSPACLAEIWEEIQHKEIQAAAINSVGEGDGGGGTARGDLEMARRLANLEGAPKAAWKKVSAALDSIFADAAEWPEWRGELYLELHRGTYTTQSRTKRYNRRLEFLLRNTEWLGVLATLEGSAPYPRELLLDCWKTLLTNQFHDIIPGSSVHRVYVEAEAAYQKIEATLTEAGTTLKRTVAGGAGNGKGMVVFNDLSWERHDPVSLPAAGLEGVNALEGAGGTGIRPLQRYLDLDGGERVVFSPALPPLGWARFRPATVPPAAAASGPAAAGNSPFTYKDGTLKTPFYQIRFDTAGRISSLIDLRENRELAAQGGCLNRLVGAQDVPVLWEAWDIDADWTRYREDETRLLSSEPAADGPVSFRLRQTYRIGAASTLVQDLVLYAEDPRIDFESKIDWRERRRLLKVEFDTAIDTMQIRCEVQYGHLLRNSHRNLPQDRAKFEICAHKWISLEEAGGGLALLNDCKYGHDVEGGRVRLTLLRSPTAPDEDADQGEHRFTYSLLPFTGSFGESRVVRAGYELNVPASVIPAGSEAGAPTGYSLCSLSGDAVIAESVKAPEGPAQGPGLVLRLYESLGGHARTTLRFSRDLAGAFATDMLEDKPEALAVSGRELALEFRAFEIKTILVSFR
ncbi:MAG: glycosyl hydrolase-related protein [Spirochaetaceae bacterium]|jgi:alpha-mannosidase|nr:glycosyl hydrolase-related protein [Spirochaetaceae bacterium]